MKCFYKLVMVVCLLFGHSFLGAMDVKEVSYGQLHSKLIDILKNEQESLGGDLGTIELGAGLNLKTFLIAAFGLPPFDEDQIFDFSQLTVYMKDNDGNPSGMLLDSPTNISKILYQIVQETKDDLKKFIEIKIPTSGNFKNFVKNEAKKSFKNLPDFLGKNSDEVNSNIRKVTGKTWDEITENYLADEKNYAACFELQKYETTLYLEPVRKTVTTSLANPRRKTRSEFLLSYYQSIDNYIKKQWEISSKKQDLTQLQTALITLKSKLIELQSSLNNLASPKKATTPSGGGKTKETKTAQPKAQRSPAEIKAANEKFLYECHFAIDTKELKSYLDAGADINTREKARNDAALHIVLSGGRKGKPETALAAVIFLCEQPGIDLNPQDTSGTTPLLKAVKYANSNSNSNSTWTEIVAALVRAWADPTIKNNNGESPNSIAKPEVKAAIDEALKARRR